MLFLAQQFPVRRESVFLRAADDLHADVGLVHHEIEELGCTGEIGDEVHRVAIVVDEIQAAIVIEPWYLHQVVYAVDVRTLCVPLRAGTIHQLALQIECPRVIEAAEHLVVTLLLAAHHGAAVRAGVEERAHVVVFAAHENQLAPPHRARQEITLRRHFGLVSDVKPAGVENVPAFAFEDGRVDEDTTVHTEQPARAVFADIRFDDRLGFDGTHPNLPFTYRVGRLVTCRRIECKVQSISAFSIVFDNLIR
jgi:hypothetical protein